MKKALHQLSCQNEAVMKARGAAAWLPNTPSSTCGSGMSTWAAPRRGLPDTGAMPTSSEALRNVAADLEARHEPNLPRSVLDASWSE